MSTDPSPKARSMDLVSVLQHDRNVRLAYWIGMLIGAGVLMVLWFDGDVGPDHPVFALIVTIWTAVLTAGVAVPVCDVCLPAGVASPRASAYSTASSASDLRLAARALRMESPQRLPRVGILHYQDPLTLPGTGCARRWRCPRQPALPSTYYWPPSHFSPGTRGAHCGYCCRVWSFISTRCCSSAPSCFDSSLYWIVPAYDLGEAILGGFATSVDMLWQSPNKLFAANSVSVSQPGRWSLYCKS